MINSLTPNAMRGRETFHIPGERHTASVDMDTDFNIELSATKSILTGTDNAAFYVAPTDGPVVLPIMLKGVPILASLSSNSCATVVPRSIVETFSLKTRDITSSQFTTLYGSSVTAQSVVDELKFYLGDIEICLNNAVVLSDESVLLGNLQLGMDFFDSSAWTRCSTNVADTFAITDGGFSSNVMGEVGKIFLTS